MLPQYVYIPLLDTALKPFDVLMWFHPVEVGACVW